MSPCFSLPILFCLLPLFSVAQPWDAATISNKSEPHFLSAVEALREFISLPNDGHFPEQIQSNLAWCVNAFKKRNFSTQVITKNEVPFVVATRQFRPGAPTVLFYLQIDGQAVDPEKWQQEDPFRAVLKARQPDTSWQIIPWDTLHTHFDPDWRIFGRSSSDSKGPAIAFITALDVVFEAGFNPDYNIKVIMDFQEEMSSPQLPVLVQENKELLAADCLVVMDGTRHVSNLPTLTFGARGMSTATLRVFGPRTAMHSGQYGNFIPNPVFRLAKLLAGMKDDDGRVIIPGYYDGVFLAEAEKALLRDIPENAEAIAHSAGIAAPEKVGDNYQEALQYPTLNVRGLQAAWVGDQARTVIPAEALALIDVRLVPESDGKRLMELIGHYITDQGYHLVDGEPTEEERRKYDKLASFQYKISYAAYRTPFDAPVGQWLKRALQRTFGTDPVMMRTTGGSQPISPFITALNIPAVAVRIPNPDNNIHAPNENLRLGNFLEGIRTCVGILTEDIGD